MKEKIAIEGMSCEHCVARVTKTIEELDGVEKVKVHLKKGLASIKFDESKVTATEIINRINTATNYVAKHQS